MCLFFLAGTGSHRQVTPPLTTLFLSFMVEVVMPVHKPAETKRPRIWFTVGSKNVNSFVIGFGAHLDDVSHEETDGRLTREQD